MTYTSVIGAVCDPIIRTIVKIMVALRIHPNALTFVGLLINVYAAYLLAKGNFWGGGWVVVGASLFDMLDGRVARTTNKVTRFGGFFDSVLDRYSDLILLMGLLVYYGSINRSAYVVLTAVVMTSSVMISYTRARAENIILKCKVGFMERPERMVLLMIGTLFDRMAPVLWVIALLGTVTVIHRILYTYQQATLLEDAQLRSGLRPSEDEPAAATTPARH